LRQVRTSSQRLNNLLSAFIPSYSVNAEEDDIDEPTVKESPTKGKVGSKTDDEVVQRFVIFPKSALQMTTETGSTCLRTRLSRALLICLSLTERKLT
jgi:hypothetical protein